ncbi:hypothetical protein C4D60_Mb08t08120 [Musa balbisiana]|uniref:Uncharacterized protein n=1 Tax=Musa balbisiana TaxID=52838 RepID=A0A4S8K286_MUSBA|nr:hypothetical protein C4D60_Mb08t08120 [Musa balbisiana]
MRLLLGIMATGAINVVRGTRSSNEELLHIYDHSERGKYGSGYPVMSRVFECLLRCFVEVR